MAETSFKPKPDGSRFDLIAEIAHTRRQIVVNPRVQRRAQFQHLAVMNRQILLPFLIPGHVADERMDMKIGIIGAAGFMLEQSGQHLSRRLGHLFIGQISAPIPHIDLLLKPFQFVLHRSVKLALSPDHPPPQPH